MKPAQAQVLVEKVHPAAKAVIGVSKATKTQKKKLRGAMAEVVSVEV